MTPVLITKKGYQELEDKLTHLKAVVRAEVSEEIKVARGFGDLSENAEYDAAKKRQAEVERDILEIEAKLNHAKIITPIVVSYCDVVGGVDGTPRTFKVVGSAEADLKQGSIGFESPIGSALSSTPVGHVATVKLPNGNTKQLKVLSVEEIEG